VLPDLLDAFTDSFHHTGVQATLHYLIEQAVTDISAARSLANGIREVNLNASLREIFGRMRCARVVVVKMH
jgi:hypothetical protein